MAQGTGRTVASATYPDWGIRRYASITGSFSVRRFPRQETRQCCGQMVRGLLLQLEDHNCWTISEAVGIAGRTGCSTCYRARLGRLS